MKLLFTCKKLKLRENPIFSPKKLIDTLFKRKNRVFLGKKKVFIYEI